MSLREKCAVKLHFWAKNNLRKCCSYLSDEKTIAWDRGKHNKFTIKLKSLRILQDHRKEAGGVWEKYWSDSTLFAIQVLLDNSSVLCNKLFWGNPCIYKKNRKFTHHFVLFRLYLQTPQAAQSRHPTCVVIHGAKGMV